MNRSMRDQSPPKAYKLGSPRLTTWLMLATIAVCGAVFGFAVFQMVTS
jgi:hypothetical protein